MKKVWLMFAAGVVISLAFFKLSYEQRQEVAKFVIMCFLIAGFISPVGLALGKLLRKVIKKD